MLMLGYKGLKTCRQNLPYHVSSKQYISETCHSESRSYKETEISYSNNSQ